MSKIRRYKLKSGNILEVFPDTYVESPDEFFPNDDVFLVYEHRQFAVEKNEHTARRVFDYLEDCHNQIENTDYDNYFIFAVDAYIHSGVRLSLASTENFPDRRWDVSTTGYVLVDKEYADTNGYPPTHVTPEQFAKVCAEELIKTWNQYLSGEVYGLRIYKQINLVEEVTNQVIEQFKKTKYFTKKSLEFSTTVIKDILRKNLPDNIIEVRIDSCYGFYGSDINTNGIVEYIEDEIIEEIV